MNDSKWKQHIGSNWTHMQNFSATFFKTAFQQHLLFSRTCFSAALAFQQHLQEHCTSASQGSKMIHEVPGPQLSDVIFTVQSILHSFLLKSKGCWKAFKCQPMLKSIGHMLRSIDTLCMLPADWPLVAENQAFKLIPQGSVVLQAQLLEIKLFAMHWASHLQIPKKSSGSVTNSYVKEEVDSQSTSSFT